MAVAIDESCWQQAFSSVEELFEIESLFLEQKEAIRTFIEKDVSIFVSLPAGAGKSLIFQSLPFVFRLKAPLPSTRCFSLIFTMTLRHNKQISVMLFT